MDGVIESNSAIQLEKLVVQVLCVGTPEGSIQEESQRLLRDYHWHDLVCHAVYHALLSLPSGNPLILRELLPSKLTRCGYPDVEWEQFFSPHSFSRKEAIALLHEMKSSGPPVTKRLLLP